VLYRLTNRITVGKLQLNFCNEVEVVSTWENLTDTATIKIPKKLTVENKPIVEGERAVFKIGDKVTIECGYNYQHQTIFSGYVTDVKTKYPLELVCEDAMWLFKRQTFKKTFAQVTVKQLVDYLLTKVHIDFPIVYSFPNMSLGKFRISNATGAQVLEELRKTYGIYSFFRDGKMYVGFAYTHQDTHYRKRIPLQFTPDVIEDNLTYKSASDQRVKIHATSVLSHDNKQLTAEAGDGDGRVIPVFYYNKSQADLQHLANNLAATYKVSGFEGSITTFGTPYVRHGDLVQLTDGAISERNGGYLVKQVTRQFGQNGFRQIVEIDRKASNA
jgi:hypothetical protein